MTGIGIFMTDAGKFPHRAPRVTVIRGITYPTARRKGRRVPTYKWIAQSILEEHRRHEAAIEAERGAVSFSVQEASPGGNPIAFGIALGLSCPYCTIQHPFLPICVPAGFK